MSVAGLSGEVVSLRKMFEFYSLSVSKEKSKKEQDFSKFKQRLVSLEKEALIPKGKVRRFGAVGQKSWAFSELGPIGEQIGYFPKWKEPVALSVFTTKGGVLKSTLALNLARIAALHNIKTCVVGLDIQGDISTSLGPDSEIDENDGLEVIMEKLNSIKGLSDLFVGQVRLEGIIKGTDLEKLFLIPETPELVALNDSLSNINRREFWLKEKVVDPLKSCFDLVIMDCSPNWNKLTTNALVACDALVSPLECKINNFRNFKVFRHFLMEFKAEMHLNFESIFVPTRYSKSRKLSMDIREWYQSEVKGCTEKGIRESIIGEEATAVHQSIPEYNLSGAISRDIKELIVEIHGRVKNRVDSENLADTESHKLAKLQEKVQLELNSESIFGEAR